MTNKFLYDLKTYIFSLMLVVSFVASTETRVANAIDCETYYSGSALAGGAEVPSPVQILCPIFKVINIGILLGGVALAGMIGVGAIKLATSLGDPKGLESASKTWTYALIGGFIVVSTVAILRVVTSLFGLDYYGPEDAFTRATSAFETFLEEMWVFSD